MRLGYWELAFLGAESDWAAQAANCAADQEAFWPYHDKLFASQAGRGQGTFAKDKLKAFATELGLDAQKFNECLDAGTYAAVVQQQTGAAQQAGVRQTPTLVIDGVFVVGLQTFEYCQQIIEAQLKAGG